MIQSDAYSNLICFKCCEKLGEFSELQLLMVDIQTRLYQFVGRDVKSIRDDSVVVKVEFLNLHVSNIAMTQDDESSDDPSQSSISSHRNEIDLNSDTETSENSLAENKSSHKTDPSSQSTPSDQQNVQVKLHKHWMVQFVSIFIFIRTIDYREELNRW